MQMHHIYNRHVEAVKELISREAYPAPKVSLNPEVKDFYAFTTADLIVEDYQAGCRRLRIYLLQFKRGEKI